MYTKIIASSFTANHSTGHSHGRKSGWGPLGPPRNSVTAMAETVSRCRYSPRKNSANLMPEYSVWYPATSSVSASARSNGGRFVSASEAIAYTRKAGNIGTMFQMWFCLATMAVNDSVPAYMRTDTSARPIPTSYEIICALERIDPSSGYFEPLDQPASTTPYTEIELMASTHRMPMSRFASRNGTNRPNRWTPVPNGITANARNAGTIAATGAMR